MAFYVLFALLALCAAQNPTSYCSAPPGYFCSATVSYLVVAGGGGGGSSAGGGGGAGAYIEGTTYAMTGDYSVSVGAGGMGVSGNGRAGTSSSLFGNVAPGGGGGTNYAGGVGLSGGSGGGGGAFTTLQAGGVAISGMVVSGATYYGRNGGSGAVALTGGQAGGGGGAGSAGSNGIMGAGPGGAGGQGRVWTINNTTYAAGGFGGWQGVYAIFPSSPPANSGNGGAGSTDVKPAANGAAGIVIVSYATGINASGGNISSLRNLTLHTFISNGTFAIHAVNFTLCPAGTFTSATGSTSCQQCPGGHYCPTGTSSWARLNCGRGKYCPDGSGAPTPCPYQVPPTGGWGALQVQGPAFLVETSHCLNHCFWNFTSGGGMLSKC